MTPPHFFTCRRISYSETTKQGGIHLPSTGYIQVHAYTSFAQLPLEGVTVTVTSEDGTAIAMRLTDRSGMIIPIEIPVPDLAASQTPQTGERPFTSVNLFARLKGYEQEEYEQLQVFAETVTDQDIEMVPLAELPDAWDQTAIFKTPPQNL